MQGRIHRRSLLLVSPHRLQRTLTSKTTHTTTGTTVTAPATPKSWFWKEGRGGTEPPDAKFLAVTAVVAAVGGYAWFIDPPKHDEVEQIVQTPTSP